jgi:predicted small integral membrane protein
MIGHPSCVVALKRVECRCVSASARRRILVRLNQGGATVSAQVNQQLAKALRRSKIVFMASVCMWASLVGINNVMDYRANFQFVQHVLEMDTTFPGNPLLWRSLRWGPLQHAAYLGIIAVELLVGLLAGIAVFRMLAAKDNPEKFSNAKAIGVMALALGLLLWLAGFEAIGGEYFLMWQSHIWNGQESAFRFAVLCVLGLLFLAQHE